jgi:predicted SprT family Zn-dependent metalloprotease
MVARPWAQLWQLPELLSEITFRQNRQLKKTVARWIYDSRCIELGPRFFLYKRRQKEIICHELAHAAATLKHGRKVLPHGSEWKALVLAAGSNAHAVLHVANLNSPRRQASYASNLYEHRCPVCHASRSARRPMKHWRCVECVEIGLTGILQVSRIEIKAPPPQ